jgi:hydroxymethylbilane synthase
LLARWQANYIAATLQKAHSGLLVEEKIVITEGDRLSSGSLWNMGGKGVWVKEIESALAAKEIDLAVHSMKDVPAVLLPGLTLAAIPKRADVRDAFISRSGASLATLPPGSRVGTTSLRRQCQLLAMRRDLRVEILRGNLDTRLRKVSEGVVDAAIVACAGLDRLGLEHRITERLTVESMLPAVGQGALAIEIREADERVRRLCSVLRDEPTEIALQAERSFLSTLGASCRTPVAGWARCVGNDLTLDGLVGRPDGSEILREQRVGNITQAVALGEQLGHILLAKGAGDILRQVQ